MYTSINKFTSINKLQYLERKPRQPELVFMWVLYPGQIGIWSVKLLFCGGRKTGAPGEKPSELQDENQQQTQPTYDIELESNPGHIGGRGACAR